MQYYISSVCYREQEKSCTVARWMTCWRMLMPETTRREEVYIMEQAGTIITYTIPPETKHFVCQCGKEWHYEDAEFCSNCGKKLEGTSDKSSL